MAAITGTLAGKTEYAGAHKLLVIRATLGSASDTITLTAAAHAGVQSIVGITGAIIKTGLGANFASLQVSYTGLVITIVSTAAAGTASTSWGTIEMGVVVNIDQ